ncbi:LacI family DNA-binding transcriptional regulator [Ferrimonas senticii]|uniref:LacI family DNA-binding transcriptional regulator n=1 Tax=Ferrimonas senticii TaxID=394566 RepID=UPI000407BAC9|nr:LacI family DNA-binding transcriptional regulator [Ferrimonas senticii]
MTKGKATSFDIAHLAGVSQSTVSRALRNSPLVKAETIERVHEIARQLNYKVDKNASALRLQRAETLALLLFEDPTSDDSLINPFFHAMLGSITRACARHGYDLLVSFQQLSDDWTADYDDNHKADGLILLGYGDDLNYQPKLKQLEQQGTHFVRWGPQSALGIAVGCDNLRGGYDATAHLLELGRKRIAFLGDASEHSPEFLQRYQGYAQALVAHGMALEPRLQQSAITTENAGYHAVNQLFDDNIRFDAIFAASDLIAIGAMQGIKERGLKIPADIAVVGFDDIQVAQFTSPPLTTVRQDPHLAGEALVESLVQQIAGNRVSDITIPTELIIRQSCEN